MRIYLAAPWDHRDETRVFAKVLKQAGHVITEPWWEHHNVGAYPYEAKGSDLDELVNQAWKDYAGVLTAQRVVVLQLAKSEGKAIETGLAIAHKIPICVYTPEGLYGNLFHYLPEIKKARTFVEVLYWLTP